MDKLIKSPNIKSIQHFLSLFQPLDVSNPVQLLSVCERDFDFEIMVGNGVLISNQKILEQYFGRVSCKVEHISGTQNSRILISKVQLPTFYPVNNFLKHLHNNQGKVISIGIGSYGEETLDLDSITHMGIFGLSGYGKSSFMKYLIGQVLAYRPDIDNIFFDPKGTEFESFKHHPRTIKVGSSSDEKFSLIMALKTELAVREYFFTQGFKMVPASLAEYLSLKEKFQRDDLPAFNKIFVWVDEAHELVGDTDGNYHCLGDHFNSLLLKARSFGIHFIYSTQNPRQSNHTLRRQSNTILTFALDNSVAYFDQMELGPTLYLKGRINVMNLTERTVNAVQVPFSTSEDALRIAYGGYELSQSKSKALGFYPLKLNRKMVLDLEFFSRICGGSKLKELNGDIKDLGSLRHRFSNFTFVWPEIYDLYDEKEPKKTPQESKKLKETKERLASLEEFLAEVSPGEKQEVEPPRSILKLDGISLTNNHPETKKFVRDFKKLLKSSLLDFSFCLTDLSKNVGLNLLRAYVSGGVKGEFTTPMKSLALGEELTFKLNQHLQEVSHALQMRNNLPLLIISGKRGMGKRTIVEAMGLELNLPVKDFVPADMVREDNKEDTEILVFSDIKSAIGFTRLGRKGKVPVLVFTIEEPVETLLGMSKPERPDFQYLNLHHTLLNIPDKHYQKEGVGEELISSLLTKHGYKGSIVSPFDFSRKRIKLTPFHLNAVIARASQKADFISQPFSEDILKEILDTTSKNTLISNSNVLIIPPSRKMGDLVVGKDHVQEITQIINRAKGRRENKYQFLKKLRPSGRVVALFSGPPGTGKSMSAEVIAGELGVDCWQCDFSRLQGKYVGETEKLLTEVFEEAESSGAVLLIDECDAFLNRELDSDYSRKIANHFLNLINNFKGVLILTTNHASYLDGAFNRRIDFKIAFKYPDVDQMTQILKNLLLPDAPVEGNWDYKDLFKGISLSGGLLLNAVEKAVGIMEQEGLGGISFGIMRLALEETQKGNNVVIERKRTMGIAG